MFLVDSEIAELIERGVVIGDSKEALMKNIQPGSLDVRIGYKLLEENRPPWFLRWFWWLHPELERRLRAARENEWIEVDLSAYSEETPYRLRPRRFILTETLEMFGFDPDIAADFVLKSSVAREGGDNLFAGWCDFGYGGGPDGERNYSRLTLELINVRRWRALTLYPGKKIGQMIFYRSAKLPARPYYLKGQYNGDKTVQPSKGIR